MCENDGFRDVVDTSFEKTGDVAISQCGEIRVSAGTGVEQE